MDGWTSKRNESLYNYIISTPTRKEYLIALKNYSAKSQTGEFLAENALKQMSDCPEAKIIKGICKYQKESLNS